MMTVIHGNGEVVEQSGSLLPASQRIGSAGIDHAFAAGFVEGLYYDKPIDLFLIPAMARRAGLRFAFGHYDYSVAWILQTFLGLFGIHRFYLGKIWTGLLWLVTGGLIRIGWLYDFCTLNRQVNERNLG